MLSFLKRIRNKTPKYLNNVWYNQSVWTNNEKYPIVLDENGRYIDCEIGLVINMGQTKAGENIYYKVVKMWRTQGGDFYYPSDAINCKLQFNHYSKK